MGNKVTSSYNLQVVNPTLSKEWHPQKNLPLKPNDVTPNSHKKVWWLCKINNSHEWEATVHNRKSGTGCPFCANIEVNDSNCLATIMPSLAKEWHPVKNEKITPQTVVAGTHRKIWWQCKRNHSHEWQATISSRVNGSKCPFCNSKSSAVELRIFAELQKLLLTAEHRYKFNGVECDIYLPKNSFAIEIDGSYWHRNKYTLDSKKNKTLSEAGVFLLRLRGKGLKKILPTDIFYLDNKIDIMLMHKIVKIILVYAKNLSQEIRDILNSYLLSNEFVNEKGYIQLLDRMEKPAVGKSLAEIAPELSKEWHDIKNGTLKPSDVTCGSKQSVWWKCKNGHEWKSDVNNRNRGNNCPFCSGRNASETNSLASRRPQLVREWHPTRNKLLTPESVTFRSDKKIWWMCKTNPKHIWIARVADRSAGSGCPFCNHKITENSYNLAIIKPYLAKEWHKTKNGSLKPNQVLPCSTQKVWWKCSRGHEWQQKISNRYNGNNCPYCSNQKVCFDNCLQTKNPVLSKEWHPTKNINITAKDVTSGSNKKVWWICKNKHEWQTTVKSRSHGRKCPKCKN